MRQIELFHFIISTPRSGSTWLMNALNQHPDIYASEFRLFGDFCEIWPDNNGKHSPRITLDKFAKATAMHFQFLPLGLNRKEFIEQFQVDYFQFLKEFVGRRSKKQVMVDKITPYAGTARLVVESIKRHFPSAKIFYLIRDGRDVVTSGAFDWLSRRDNSLPAFRYFISRESDFVLDRFFDDQFLSDWSRHWVECHQAVRDSGFHTLEIQYESMLNNQANELARIFDLLEIDSTEQLCQHCVEQVSFELSTGRKAGVAEPLAKARRGVAGDWRNYFTRKDGVLFDQLAGQQLIETGYETDNQWLESLPDKLELSR